MKKKTKNTERGFVPIRRGIYDHLVDGRMTGDEFLIFVVLLLKADHKCGVVHKVSAPSLAGLLRIPARTVSRRLKCLENKGYIKRFNHHGQCRYYGLIIDKYVTPNCLLINARKTLSLKEIAFSSEGPCLLNGEQVAGKWRASGGQVAGIQDLNKIITTPQQEAGGDFASPENEKYAKSKTTRELLAESREHYRKEDEARAARNRKEENQS